MTVPTVAAALTTALIAYGTWVHPGIHKYATEVVVELRKVVWPGRDELRDSTIIVVGCVVVFAAVLGGFDFIWAKVTNLILYRSGA